MKKFIGLVLMLTLCVSVFAGCGQETPAPAPADEQPAEATGYSDLAAAKEYLVSMYRNAPSTHVEDYQLVGKLVVGDSTFNVEWTADSEAVKFVKGDDGMVTVDIDEKNPEEVKYTLTATISDESGNSETAEYQHRVPAAILIDDSMTDEEIVTAAYKLENGVSIATPATLTGVVSSIDSEYNPKYKNLNLTMVVGELEENPIVCFRLGGEGAEIVKIGDTITVTGTLKNFKGTIEFDAGCSLDAIG